MMEKYNRVYAKINLDAITYNLNQMKSNIGTDTKIIAVIKADGYGHGAVPIAKELEALDYLQGFAAATAEEALIIRHCGVKKPILVLGCTFPFYYEEMIKEEIRFTVFKENMAEQLEECANRLGRKAKVHIKVDTGMNRIGIMPNQTGLDFVKKLTAMPAIEIEGIFTHFARADEADKTAVRRQLVRFLDFVRKAEKETGRHIPVCHSSNSAGIVELKEANMDAVRAGIILYGLWPSKEIRRDRIDLKPALELKSCIAFVKEIEKGEEVSYGGTYTTARRTRIATIPLGYADGYPRSLSNIGSVLVCGKRAPIIGRVCMDQFMIDITDIKEAQEGSVITLIGRDGGECITMEELETLSGRFNYELACCIGSRVPKVYVKGEKIVYMKDYFSDFK